MYCIVGNCVWSKTHGADGTVKAFSQDNGNVFVNYINSMEIKISRDGGRVR